jgi:hypothetical protein
MAVSEVRARDDPDLAPAEKEVIVRWARDEDRARIFAEQSTVLEWLHRHPEYRVEATRSEDGVLYSTEGTLPVGCVKFSGTSRRSDATSRVLGRLPEEADRS